MARAYRLAALRAENVAGRLRHQLWQLAHGGVPQLPEAVRADRDAAYYRDLHEGDAHYRANNWLVPELGRIVAAKPASVLEIGSGNGRFLRAVAPHVDRVIGLDWAAQEEGAELPPNATLRTADVLAADLPAVDLVCSADVLEHIAPAALPGLIHRIHATAPLNYHVLACYDDRHSHLTVMSPGEWLALFLTAAPGYDIRDLRVRRGKADALICVIANF